VSCSSTEAGGFIDEPLKFFVVDHALGIVVEAEGLFAEGDAAFFTPKSLNGTKGFSFSFPEFLKKMVFMFADFFHFIFIVKRTVRVGTEWWVFHYNLLRKKFDGLVFF
jgi:hypothetical protein